MKFLLLFILAIFMNSLYSQEKEVKVFIKGQAGKDTVDIDFLQKGFDLEVSDTNFKIKSFVVSWDYGDWIYQMAVNGTRVEPGKEKHSLKQTAPNSLFAFDNITAAREGRSFRLPSFVVLAGDPDKSHPTIKSPVICHNLKKELACYDDGTYKLHFSKNEFTGFSTTDSVIHYDENQKKFELKVSANNVATIQLRGNNIFIKTSESEHSFSSIPNEIIKDGEIEIRLKPSSFKDTIEFTVAGKRFTLEIIRLFKEWYWEITERHNSSIFYITYHYKKKRPGIISIKDQNMKYGMVIHSRFRSLKKVWILKSNFVYKYWEKDHYVVTTLPLDPSYYYTYNRFGKLRKKKTSGNIKYCNCKE